MVEGYWTTVDTVENESLSWLVESSSAAGEQQEDVLDWVRGIGTGAATGAGTGVAAGPWGALIGGLVGGTLGAVQTATQQRQARRSRRRSSRTQPAARTPAAPAPAPRTGGGAQPAGAQQLASIPPELLQQLLQQLPIIVQALSSRPPTREEWDAVEQLAELAEDMEDDESAAAAIVPIIIQLLPTLLPLLVNLLVPLLTKALPAVINAFSAAGSKSKSGAARQSQQESDEWEDYRLEGISLDGGWPEGSTIDNEDDDFSAEYSAEYGVDQEDYYEDEDFADEDETADLAHPWDSPQETADDWLDEDWDVDDVTLETGT